jgi:uncharacterized protein (TIGR03435 family)
MVRARVGLAVALCAQPFGIAAQSPPSSERFVVASIKPFESGGQRQGRAAPDQYLRVATLSSFLQEAFDLPPFLMSGLPDWADERWEVSAKAEGPRSREEMRPLLRALLADRFALRTHVEKQELPVYELLFVREDKRRGPEFKPATGECDPFTNGQRPFSESPLDRNGQSRCLGGILNFGERMSVHLHNYTVQRFADALRPYVRRAVVDKTGVSGLFDFVFDFASGVFSPSDVTDTGNIPSLETALRESLGLRLQSARGMVDVLVIDSVERPSPN